MTDAPLPTRPLFIDVVTRNLDNPDALPDRKRVNYNNPRSRAYHDRYVTWALNNRHSVTVAPAVIGED